MYIYRIIHKLWHFFSEPDAHLPLLIERRDRSFFKLFIAQILFFVCRRLLKNVAIFLAGCSAIGYTIGSNSRYGTNAFVLLYYCPTWNNREASGSTSGEELIGARRRRKRMAWSGDAETERCESGKERERERWKRERGDRGVMGRVK